MTGWHRGPMLAFDTETSGVSIEMDCIVTACIALIDGSGKGAPKVTQWLAKPSVDIAPKATEVHGISTEYAREHGAEPALVVAEIIAELHTAIDAGIPLVVYNAQFDLSLLDREARRYDLPTLDQVLGREIAPVIDPLVIDKTVDQFRRGSRKLTAVCEHYNVPINGAHDATQDALAAARMAWRIAEQHRHIGQMDLMGLHQMQARAKPEQAESFIAYLKSRRKPYDDVRSEWPLIPFEGQAVIA